MSEILSTIDVAKRVIQVKNHVEKHHGPIPLQIDGTPLYVDVLRSIVKHSTDAWAVGLAHEALKLEEL